MDIEFEILGVKLVCGPIISSDSIPASTLIITFSCGEGFDYSDWSKSTLKKQVGCFNHRVVTTVADKLKRQWL